MVCMAAIWSLRQGGRGGRHRHVVRPEGSVYLPWVLYRYWYPSRIIMLEFFFY